MGVCSSCLGWRKAQPEDPETSRLLYDDPYRPQYGSQISRGPQHVNQPDPESLRLEREALERICYVMSSNVIDVFTTLPESVEKDKSPTLQVSHADGKASQSAPTDVPKRKVIKKSKGKGALVSTLSRDTNRWKAVKDAIG
ncbi:MAG: hypothetical protein MMC33_004169 [Icmadophila ericetorum]|nr:hypothetical protein [Icmadophila ericetorum]